MRLGLRMLVIGLVICALGGVSLWLGMSGIPMGDGRRIHGARFVLLGASILVAGTVPAVRALEDAHRRRCVVACVRPMKA